MGDALKVEGHGLKSIIEKEIDKTYRFCSIRVYCSVIIKAEEHVHVHTGNLYEEAHTRSLLANIAINAGSRNACTLNECL